MPTSSTATDLKRRLEHARRRQREVEQGRARDESGVRPLVREPLPLEPPPREPSAVLPSEPTDSATLVSAARKPVALPWRGALLLLAGGLIGAGAAIAIPAMRVAEAPRSVNASPHNPLALEVTGMPKAGPLTAAPEDPSHSLELRSEPAGAEIVLRGAVVANTPARVPRPTYPALYLLRLSGYHPQLVRVSPQSGDVVVDLRPLSEELPSSSATTQGARAKPKPDRGRGHDVGRQPAPGRSDGLVVGGSSR